MFKLFGKKDFVGINYADDNATNQATTEDAGLILIWVQLQGSAHWLSAGEILKVTFISQHKGAMVEHLLHGVTVTSGKNSKQPCCAVFAEVKVRRNQTICNCSAAVLFGFKMVNLKCT